MGHLLQVFFYVSVKEDSTIGKKDTVKTAGIIAGVVVVAVIGTIIVGLICHRKVQKKTRETLMPKRYDKTFSCHSTFEVTRRHYYFAIVPRKMYFEQNYAK